MNSSHILCTPSEAVKVTRKEMNYLTSQVSRHFSSNLDFLIWMIQMDCYLLELLQLRSFYHEVEDLLCQDSLSFIFLGYQDRSYLHGLGSFILLLLRFQHVSQQTFRATLHEAHSVFVVNLTCW